MCVWVEREREEERKRGGERKCVHNKVNDKRGYILTSSHREGVKVNDKRGYILTYSHREGVKM